VNLLEIRNLEIWYGDIRILKAVDIDVKKGETLVIVGESGSGKTTLANAIMRSLPKIARIGESSRIYFNDLDGRERIDLLQLDDAEFREKVRWRYISMVTQSTMNVFNPTMNIRDHFIETAKSHSFNDKEKVIEKTASLLKMVNLDPSRVLKAFPHELSGGMKQRVSIALALLLNPKIMILDEPTTALDVITQRVILDLLKDIKRKMDLTYILITHDLGLVADIADRIVVLYAGSIMENGSIEDIFYRPCNPYTIGLLNSVPKLGEFRELVSIPGSPPDYRKLPRGCKFSPRCPISIQGTCDVIEPSLTEVAPGHSVACHNCKLALEKGVKIYNH